MPHDTVTAPGLAANAYEFAYNYDPHNPEAPAQTTDVWECYPANHAWDYLARTYAASTSPQRLDFLNPEPIGECTGATLKFSYKLIDNTQMIATINLGDEPTCDALRRDIYDSTRSPRDAQRAHLIHATSGAKPVMYRYQLSP